MISGDLFRSVLDVHVKRGAKLPTDHNLLICSLHLEKSPGPTQTCTTRRSYRIEWESLVDKDIWKIFCRQRPCSKNFKECTADAEVEWLLLAAASSATQVWGRKRLSASNNGKKRSARVEPRYEQCYSSCLPNLDSQQSRLNRSLHLRYVETRKSAALTVKRSKIMQSWEKSRHKLGSNYWKANNMFWQTFRRLRGKRSHAAKSVKEKKWCLTQ